MLRRQLHDIFFILVITTIIFSDILREMIQFIPMVKTAYERRCQQHTDCPQALY